MTMNQSSRRALLATFDQSRAAFLASIDQVVAGVRPILAAVPESYPSMLLACASSFADPVLVREQLAEVSPELLEQVADDDIHEAHLITVSYLFSLVLHEMIRTTPDPTPEESPA